MLIYLFFLFFAVSGHSNNKTTTKETKLSAFWLAEAEAAKPVWASWIPWFAVPLGLGPEQVVVEISVPSWEQGE